MLMAGQWRYAGPDGQEDMPWLMGAGPVTTSRTVKAQMMADWSFGDPLYQSMVEQVRLGLLRLAGAGPDCVCLLMPAPETVAVEAALATFAPESRRRKTLVVSNGADGERVAQMLDRLRRPFSLLAKDDRTAVVPGEIESALMTDDDIAMVLLAHCQSSSGLLNPVADIAPLVRTRGRVVAVNASNTLGALLIDMEATGIDIVVGVSHRCLEGVAGLSFVICRRDLLESARGVTLPVSLDLVARHEAAVAGDVSDLPTQAVAALAQALKELDAEGGREARLSRYRRGCKQLVEGMRELGFVHLLSAEQSLPALQTFLLPAGGFDFTAFDAGLKARGFVISPGQLVGTPSFRIGLSGRIGAGVITRFLAAVRDLVRA
ncbi:MAG: aminotransferase class V-fold PLP-dependent enzyme [Hyphomicrobiales bacterium]